MKNLFIAVAVALAMPADAAAGSPVDGDGRKITATRPLDSGVTRIVAEGSLDLEIREAPRASLELTLDSNLHEFVATAVSGDTLRIGLTRSVRFEGEGKIVVDLPALEALSLSGSGDAKVTAGAQKRDMELFTHGSGDITFEGVAERLAIESNGSGDVTVRGKLRELAAKERGSGDLEYSGKADGIELRNSGSGDARLEGLVQELAIESRGSGDVSARNLRAKNAVVALYGSGDASITLDGGTLRASIRGSGDLDWWGTARVESATNVGSGSIEHHE